MKKRECCLVGCCHPASNFALLQREERERLPDDVTAKAEAALFMTLFGLGGLEGPEAADRQTGGREGGHADGQSDRQTRRSFSGGFCTSAFFTSRQLFRVSRKARQIRQKSGWKGKWKATNDGRVQKVAQ